MHYSSTSQSDFSTRKTTLVQQTKPPLRFGPANRSTLVESVKKQIIAPIREGQLKPGDRLPSERAFMDMMNVGRSTVREALQSLAAMNLIETRSGAGSVVKDSFQLSTLIASSHGMGDTHQIASAYEVGDSQGIERPCLTLIPTPPLVEMEAGLREWAAAHPQHLHVETVGESPGGLPVLLCRITDAAVDDTDKQVVLITTTHSGLERRATSTVLKFIRWLISDDPLVVEIRRKQIVLAMPCCEPEGYESKTTDNSGYYTERTGKVYEGWTWDGLEDPANQPEAMALKQVMDQYQPDMHQDVHGIWYAESTQWEHTGASWASNLYRSYVPQISYLMDEAAEEAGFLMVRAEEAAGQILASVPVPGAEHWFYGATSKQAVVAGLYAYRQYHSIPQVMDVGWDESGLVRLRRLLELGNEVWRGEYYKGYPAHQIGCWTSMAVAAWGMTAAERRKSRVELWQKRPQLWFACAHPEPRNSIGAFIATSPEAHSRFENNCILEAVIARLKEYDWFNGEGLDDYLRQSPAHCINFRQPGYDGPAEPIQHGLAIRLLIPYPQVRFKHLKLDGHDLHPSETDGYTVYHDPGTIVQVNIPPGKVRDVHFATAVFESDEERATGFSSHDWQLD